MPERWSGCGDRGGAVKSESVVPFETHQIFRRSTLCPRRSAQRVLPWLPGCVSSPDAFEHADSLEGGYGQVLAGYLVRLPAIRLRATRLLYFQFRSSLASGCRARSHSFVRPAAIRCHGQNAAFVRLSWRQTGRSRRQLEPSLYLPVSL